MLDRVVVLALFVLSCALPMGVHAEPPRVHFDIPYAVACRDVTPAEYASSHPGQKLMEAKLAISALLVAGEEKDLTEFFIRVDSPQRTLERQERRLQVLAAINKLSPDLRECVILRDIEELTYQEIVDLLQIPEGTVKSRINRGRIELAKVLRRMKVNPD